MLESLENAAKVLVSLLPAITGGIARYLHDVTSTDNKFEFRTFVAHLFIAAVVGSWLVAVTDSAPFFETYPAMVGAVVGVSGAVSPEIFNFLIKHSPKALRRFFGKYIGEDSLPRDKKPVK